MALLAEELVQEWLNRAGFFTIRGVRLGVHEMDLLAVRPTSTGLECRHIEVQASVNPVSYLFRLTKEDQRATGRTATSSGVRTAEQLERGADEWVAKKFGLPQKQALLSRLAPGCKWTRELVVHRLAHSEELLLLKARGIVVHQLEDLVRELAEPGIAISRASGGDFLDLVLLGKSGQPIEVVLPVEEADENSDAV